MLDHSWKYLKHRRSESISMYFAEMTHLSSAFTCTSKVSTRDFSLGIRDNFLHSNNFCNPTTSSRRLLNTIISRMYLVDYNSELSARKLSNARPALFLCPSLKMFQIRMTSHKPIWVMRS